MTGRAARVEMQLPSAALMGSSIPLLVEVTAQQERLFVRELYLLIQATERVRLENIQSNDLIQNQDDDGDIEDAIHDAVTYEEHLTLARDLHLEAGRKQRWESTLTLPSDGLPTWEGVHSSHRWTVQARLDVMGADPRSDAMVLNVYAHPDGLPEDLR
uniref:Uncharacterized protein n=1 Tax=Magnetococcus massalia (strain MO-1) TaxID=451514 RepID=A0A1S7LMJ5_MAGMO|nr:conserved protein of unknown function [Candidatus Magnetococcus massalia]